ncbi:MAG: DUF7487 domain-containing protein [Nitrosopumilaceae archaeon]
MNVKEKLYIPITLAGLKLSKNCLLFCILNNIRPPLCKVCGKLVISWNYKKKAFRECCSYKCAASSPDRDKRTKQTMLKRYGVEHILQSEKFKQKNKQTNLERYGVENPSQSEKFKEKRKQTMLKRYGVEHILQSEKFKQKNKQTNLERYGVENPFQTKQFKETKRKTCLEKYGVGHPSQSQITKEKRKQTNLEKHGTKTYAQKHMIGILPLLQDYDWLYDQYVNKKKTATQIAEELNICDGTIGAYLRSHDITIKLINGFSYKCILWLESIMKQQNIFIQHAQNIGEYSISSTRFHVDGYCKETNAVYEFYGDMWHGNPTIFESHICCNLFSDLTASELYQKTIERENIIKSLGYNLITIWESDWIQ